MTVLTAERTRVEPTVVLDLDGITKRYSDHVAVDDVSLQLREGETLAIVGPSGCGKSTLLKAIAGLISVEDGSITLSDRVVSDASVFVPTEKRGVGVVFQDLALFPHLTVADNIAFGVKHGRGAKNAATTEEMLELVGLKGKAHRYPHELSGGEQQRVAIARALILKPAVVLLDEPFSHLDRGLAVQMRTEAMATLRRAGATVILVTHDQEEALAVGDRVAVMRDGRIQHLGTPAEIYHKPASEFVARFVGEASFFPAHRLGDHAESALGLVPVEGASDGDVVMMTRPHDLVIRPVSACEAAAEQVIGEVIASEFRGSYIMHVVRGPGGVVMHGHSDHADIVHVGERVQVELPDHPLWCLPKAETQAV